MTTKTMVLPEKAFFHARPAAAIALAAKGFESMVMVALGVELADAKNPMALMRMSRLNGRPFDVFADGPDEKEAVEAVEAAIRSAF